MRRMISDTLQTYLKAVKANYPDPSNIGGSSYSAGKGIDITDDAISVDTTDLTATSTSSVTPATVTLTFTYSDNTTADITLMTGATVSTTTTLGTTE